MKKRFINSGPHPQYSVASKGGRLCAVNHNCCLPLFHGHLGPVVQSIVSLTSSLRGQLVKCFKNLYPNTLIFLLKKCEKLLHCNDKM